VSISLVPLILHSTWNIYVTMKCGLGIVQGHWKWRRSVIICHFI